MFLHIIPSCWWEASRKLISMLHLSTSRVSKNVRVGVHLVAYSHLNNSVVTELRWPVCSREPA